MRLARVPAVIFIIFIIGIIQLIKRVEKAKLLRWRDRFQTDPGPPASPEEPKDNCELYARNIEIVRKALIPPPSSSNNTRPPVGTKQFFSQLGQDQWVSEKIFPGKHNGRFIEAGALDGLRISNTRHFDLHYNWTGILIEPDPDNFERLKKSGRNAWLLHGCIGSDPIKIQNLTLKPGDAGSFVVDLKGIFNRDPKPKTDNLVTVQCYPLNLILDALGWTSVDYWSLDVEGAEPAILQAVDFDRFRFGLIDVECASCGEYLNPGVKMKQSPQMEMRFFIKHLMSLKGYKEVGIVHHDLMYQPVN